MEHASTHTQLNFNEVEIIQRQVARYIYSDFSWHSIVHQIYMLHLLYLPTLSYHRDKTMIIFLYKIIHKLVDITSPASYLPISRDTCGPSL